MEIAIERRVEEEFMDCPDEDTERLSQEDIAYNIFSTRCLMVWRTTGITKAGRFATVETFKYAKKDLILAVGPEKADELMSDWFIDNSNLFN